MEILPLVKRNWAAPQRSDRVRIWISWRAQTSPADAAGKTKTIERFRIIVGNARRKHRRFPGRQRQLAAVELFQHRLQTFRSFNAMIDIDTLPREQKSIEILNRDRLNFRAQPVDGEPMNSREQSAVAPFLVGCAVMKFSAQNKAFAFESEQSGFNF